MPRKRRVLTEYEKSNILAIITAGCSRETAARYARCSVKKIREEIALDPKFAAEIVRAEEESEIFFINKIRKAADKEQYWRAAAWALERRCPNRYAARGAGTLSMDQVRELVSKLADIVVQEMPGGTERRRLLKRIHEMIKENGPSRSVQKSDVAEHEDDGF